MDSHQPPTSAPSDQFYAAFLDPEDFAAYECAPSHPDLSGDIRLLRTLIARLAENGGIRTKEVAIRQAMDTLYRLVQAQKEQDEEETHLALPPDQPVR